MIRTLVICSIGLFGISATLVGGKIATSHSSPVLNKVQDTDFPIRVQETATDEPDEEYNRVRSFLREVETTTAPATVRPTVNVPTTTGVYYQDAQGAFNRTEPAAPITVRPGWRTAQVNRSETAKAYQALKTAENDDDKEQAEKDLRDALEKEYDKSLESYETNLKKLRERLEKLEEELERRRDAKNELVDLRFKTLLNHANGLGWPGQSEPSSRAPSMFFHQNSSLLPADQPAAPTLPGFPGKRGAR